MKILSSFLTKFLILLLSFELSYSVKIQFVTSNQDLTFVPLSTGQPVSLNIDVNNLTMFRTNLRYRNKFHHIISYNPGEIGIIYYQHEEDKDVYFDLISIEFQFVFFYKSEESPTLSSDCPYKDLVNDQSFKDNLNGLDKINEYMASHEFDGEAIAAYKGTADGHNMAVFEREDTGSGFTEIPITFEEMTLDLGEKVWYDIKDEIKKIELKYPAPAKHHVFFKQTVNLSLKKLDKIVSDKIKAKNEDPDYPLMTAWETVRDKITKNLDPLYKQLTSSTQGQSE